MASTEATRVIRYTLFMSRKESSDQQKTVTDHLGFTVNGTIRLISTDLNSHRPRVMNVFNLFGASISVGYEDLFTFDRDFLGTLFVPEWPWVSQYFSPECIDKIAHMFIDRFQPRDSNLALEIFVDLPLDEENQQMDPDMIEKSTQGLRLIPVSIETVKSLKTCVLPDTCSICMKTFHAEGGDDDDVDVKFSPMPCGHVFHHQCIVEWLQTSHVCPLCAFCLRPTTKEI